MARLLQGLRDDLQRAQQEAEAQLAEAQAAASRHRELLGGQVQQAQQQLQACQGELQQALQAQQAAQQQWQQQSEVKSVAGVPVMHWCASSGSGALGLVQVPVLSTMASNAGGPCCTHF